MEFLLQVNIIPVIAKADTLTPEECARFKKTVSGEGGRRSVGEVEEEGGRGRESEKVGG